MHIDSDLLLLLARISRLRIRFDHGQRNCICTFIRFLFYQFGLLLLLLCKNVSFKSSYLRKLLPSLQPDYSSVSCILYEMLYFQKQVYSLLKQMFPLSLKLTSSPQQFLPFRLRKANKEFIAIVIGVIGCIVIVHPVSFYFQDSRD